MAYRIIWTETASEDLRGIVEFIAFDNPEAARRLAASIILQIEKTSTFPQSGRMVPEKHNPTIRESIYSPYRIIYHIEETAQTLYVTRIWHSARGMPDL